MSTLPSNQETSEYKKVHLVSYQSSQIVKSTSLIGYCHCDTHKGYLTLPILQKHQCIEKKCPFFQKFPDAPYWQMLATKKANKANSIKTKKLKQKKESDECNEVKEVAQELIWDLGYDDVHITSVKKADNPYVYKIFYVVKGGNCPLDWVSCVAYLLKERFHKGIWFTRVKRPDGRNATWADLPNNPM